MSNETYELLELVCQSQLKNVEDLDLESKEGKEALIKANTILDLLITADKDNADYYDKQERREIERQKNEAQIAVERDKQKLTWSRIGFEMAKVVVPTLVSIFAYDVFQKRIMKFEETGRICTTAGRELHLPRFMK